MDSIIQHLFGWVTGTIDSFGYYAVAVLMAIESANIPVPSELIMPYGGFLVVKMPGQYSVFGMGMAGAIGCVVGSVASYWLGVYGGRPFVEKYGKYILVHKRDLARADKWFSKYGDWAVFISRLLPIVRTFISLPAGISKVNFPRFVIYTFVGSFPWCYALAYFGMRLGEHWDAIKTYFHGADVFIGVIIVLGMALYIYHHIRGIKEEAEEQPAS